MTCLMVLTFSLSIGFLFPWTRKSNSRAVDFAFRWPGDRIAGGRAHFDLASSRAGGPRAYERQPVNAGEQLEVLRRIATQMTISCDVGEVLRTITNALVTTAKVALARVWLYGKAANCAPCVAERGRAAVAPEDAALHLAASAGLYTHVNGAHHRIAVGHLKIGEMAETRRLLWIDDVESDPRVPDKAWVRRERIRSFGGCPLLSSFATNWWVTPGRGTSASSETFSSVLASWPAARFSRWTVCSSRRSSATSPVRLAK